MKNTEKCESCSWWTQFWWLLKRSLIAQLRNPTDVTSRLLLSCWIGLLAGSHPIKLCLLLLQMIIKCSFMGVWVATVFGHFNFPSGFRMART